MRLLKCGVYDLFDVSVDDPYYCGFSARVPAFTEAATPAAAAATASRTRTTERPSARSKEPTAAPRSRDAVSTPRLVSKTLEKAATRVAKYREAGN